MTKLKLISPEKSTGANDLKSLRQREALFEASERMAKIGHYEWNHQLDRLESCTEEYARIFNMTIDEVMQFQSSWIKTLNYIHPDDHEAYKANARTFLDTGSIDGHYRILLNQGEIKHVHEYGIVVENDQGEKTTSFGLLQDVSQQVKHEQELIFKDAITEEAESLTDFGFFLFDEINDENLFISPGQAKIVGLTVDEYYHAIKSNQDYFNLVHEDDRELIKETYQRNLLDHGNWQIEYRVLRSDGEYRWIREFGKALKVNGDNVEQTIGVLQDITEQKYSEKEIIKSRDTLEQQVIERTCELDNTIKQLQAEIKEREKIAASLDFLANHDALTGLPSLRLCKDRLERSIIDAQRERQLAAVMFLDLDGFKVINDSYGHELGDLVLKATAERIQSTIRETDTVARIGGDEFLIILSKLPQVEIAKSIAEKLIIQISQAIFIDQIQVSVGASIGIAVYPHDGLVPADLIRAADKAMYRVKHSGKNNYEFV